MQIIQLPRLFHAVITEPVKAHNTDLRFIERTAVIGNMFQQLIKLLFCAVPVKRVGEFDQNCVTAALKNKIKYSVILPFCVLRDVKRQFLCTFGEVLLQCQFIKLEQNFTCNISWSCNSSKRICIFNFISASLIHHIAI